MSWVRASSLSEHEAVVTRHASTPVEETSKKSDSLDTKQWVGKATADKIARHDANMIDTNKFAENQLFENSRLNVARDPQHYQEEGQV